MVMVVMVVVMMVLMMVMVMMVVVMMLFICTCTRFPSTSHVSNPSIVDNSIHPTIHPLLPGARWMASKTRASRWSTWWSNRGRHCPCPAARRGDVTPAGERTWDWGGVPGASGSRTATSEFNQSDWLIDWPIDWLVDGLIDRLIIVI